MRIGCSVLLLPPGTVHVHLCSGVNQSVEALGSLGSSAMVRGGSAASNFKFFQGAGELEAGRAAVVAAGGAGLVLVWLSFGPFSSPPSFVPLPLPPLPVDELRFLLPG